MCRVPHSIRLNDVYFQMAAKQKVNTEAKVSALTDRETLMMENRTNEQVRYYINLKKVFLVNRVSIQGSIQLQRVFRRCAATFSRARYLTVKVR